LASGAISKSQAIGIFIGLIIADIALVFFAQMYFHQIMEICYHYWLLCGDESCLYFQIKHVPIIDILSLP
jgi:4-hydroxybenzoate polyprenyltransferase